MKSIALLNSRACCFVVLFAIFGILSSFRSALGGAQPSQIDPLASSAYGQMTAAYQSLNSYQGVSVVHAQSGLEFQAAGIYTIKTAYLRPNKFSITVYRGKALYLQAASDGRTLGLYVPRGSKYAMIDVSSSQAEDVFRVVPMQCQALALIIANDDAFQWLLNPSEGSLTMHSIDSKNPFAIPLDVIESRNGLGPSSSVVLQVGEDDHLLRSVTMINPFMGNFTEDETLVRPNVSLNSSLFTFHPPAGATKADLRTVVASLLAPAYPGPKPHIGLPAKKVLNEMHDAYASLKSLTCTSVTPGEDGRQIIAYQAPNLFSVTTYAGKKMLGWSTFDGKTLSDYSGWDDTYWQAARGSANLWDMVNWSVARCEVMQDITHPDEYSDLDSSPYLVSVSLDRSKANEEVGGVPVNVVSIKVGGPNPSQTTLKIGKSDHLLRSVLIVWPKQGGTILQEEETDVHANLPVDPSTFVFKPLQGASKINPPPPSHQLD